MCDRCEAIDRQLLNFRHAHASATEPLPLILLAEIITNLEVEKLSLHPADPIKAEDPS